MHRVHPRSPAEVRQEAGTVLGVLGLRAPLPEPTPCGR